MRLLLGSGGFSTPERKAAWSKALDQYLGTIEDVLFIPYALADYDKYVAMMMERGFHAGRNLHGIHREKDPKAAIQNAKAIYVGGGNSFRLLAELYRLNLLDSIREKIRAGAPYVGVSAGTNMACPTLKTTNDMPIVMPPSFAALSLISFQINPHYFSGAIHFESGQGSAQKMIKYGGETRDDRIREFHEMNDLPVLGLHEGAILKVEGASKVLTVGEARLFKKNLPAQDFVAGADFSKILD
jgi:dipeptidase E